MELRKLVASMDFVRVELTAGKNSSPCCLGCLLVTCALGGGVLCHIFMLYVPALLLFLHVHLHDTFYRYVLLLTLSLCVARTYAHTRLVSPYSYVT